MAQDNITKLWNAIQSEGWEDEQTKTEASLREYLKTPGNSEKLRQACLDDGWDDDVMQSKDAFDKYLGIAAEPQGTETVSAQPIMAEDGEREQKQAQSGGQQMNTAEMERRLKTSYNYIKNQWERIRINAEEPAKLPEQTPTLDQFRGMVNDEGVVRNINGSLSLLGGGGNGVLNQDYHTGEQLITMLDAAEFEGLTEQDKKNFMSANNGNGAYGYYTIYKRNENGELVPTDKKEYKLRENPDDPWRMDEEGNIYKRDVHDTVSVKDEVRASYDSINLDEIDKVLYEQGADAARNALIKAANYFITDPTNRGEVKEDTRFGSAYAAAQALWSKYLIDHKSPEEQKAEEVFNEELKKAEEEDKEAMKQVLSQPNSADGYAQTYMLGRSVRGEDRSDYNGEDNDAVSRAKKAAASYLGTALANVKDKQTKEFIINKFINNVNMEQAKRGAYRSPMDFVILGAINDSMFGKMATTMMLNDSQKYIKQLAEGYAMTAEGQNDKDVYKAGFGANMFRGYLGFGLDWAAYEAMGVLARPIAASTGEMLSTLARATEAGKSMERELAKGLIARGISSAEAYRMARVIGGREAGMSALRWTMPSTWMPAAARLSAKIVPGAVQGAITFGGVDALRTPIDMMAEPLRMADGTALSDYVTQRTASGQPLSAEELAKLVSETEDKNRGFSEIVKEAAVNGMWGALTGGAMSVAAVPQLMAYGKNGWQKLLANVTGFNLEAGAMTTVGIQRQLSDGSIEDAVMETVKAKNEQRAAMGEKALTESEIEQIRKQVKWNMFGDSFANNVGMLLGFKAKHIGGFVGSRPVEGGKRNWDLTSLWGNMKENIRQMNLQGSFEKRMEFTDYDREYLQKNYKQFVKSLDSLTEDALRNITNVGIKQKANADDITKELVKMANDSQMPLKLMQKCVYNISGVVPSVSLAADYDITETKDGRYMLYAIDASGRCVDEQYFKSEEEAEKAARRYKSEVDVNEYYKNVGNVVSNETSNNFMLYLAEDYTAIQAKSGSEWTAEDEGKVKLLEAHLKGQLEAIMDKPKEELTEEEQKIADAFQKTFAEYSERAKSIDEIKQRVADMLNVSVPQLESAVAGHDLNTALGLDRDAQLVGEDIYRTRKENEMAEALFAEMRKAGADPDGYEKEVARAKAGDVATSENTVVDSTKTDAIRSEINGLLIGQSGDAPTYYRSSVEGMAAAKTLTDNGIDINDNAKLMDIATSENYAPEIREAAQTCLNTQEVDKVTDEIIAGHVEAAAKAKREELSKYEAHNKDGLAVGSTCRVTTADNKTGWAIEGHPEVDEYVTVMYDDGTVKPMVKSKDVKDYKDSEIDDEVRSHALMVEQQLRGMIDEASSGGVIAPGMEFVGADGKTVRVVENDSDIALPEGHVNIEVDGKVKTVPVADVRKMRMEADMQRLADEKTRQQNGEAVEADAAQREQEAATTTPATPVNAQGATELTPEQKAEKQRRTGRDENGVLVSIPENENGQMNIQQADVSEVFDLIAKTSDPVEYASNKIEALEKQIDDLKSKPISGIDNPNEELAAMAQRNAEITRLTKERNMMRMLLNEQGKREMEDKNFSGLVTNQYSYYLKQKAPEWASFYDLIAKKFGLRINSVYELGDGKNNGMNNLTGTITIAIDAFENATNIKVGEKVPKAIKEDISPDKMRKSGIDYLNAVLGHELVHSLFKNNKEAMKAFIRLTQDYLGDRYKEIRDEKLLSPKYNEGNVDEEIACDMAGELMMDKNFVKRILEDPTKKEAKAGEDTVETVADVEKRQAWYEKIVDSIKNFFGIVDGVKEPVIIEPNKETNKEDQAPSMIEQLRNELDAQIRQSADAIKADHEKAVAKQIAEEQLRQQAEAERLRKEAEEAERLRRLGGLGRVPDEFDDILDGIDKKLAGIGQNASADVVAKKAKAAYEGIPDAQDVFDRMEPETPEEYVSGIGARTLLLDDLVKEIGGTNADWNRLGLTSPTGKTIAAMAHSLWEGRPNASWDDVEIANALRSVLQSAKNGRDMRRTIINNRLEEARQIAEGAMEFARQQKEDMLNAIASGEYGNVFSVRTKPAPEKTEKVYKLMRLGKDGKLYPLFIDAAAPIELGTWYDADAPDLSYLRPLASGTWLVNPKTKEVVSYDDFYAQHPELFNGKQTKYPSVAAVNWATDNGLRFMNIEDTARAQKRFDGETRKYWNLGINGSGAVSTFSMRPGWHAGSLPTMRQIGKGKDKNLRDDSFVWVEGEVSADKDYNAEVQQNPDKDMPDRIPEDGFYLKATNADKAKSQADQVGWYVAGAFKPNRIMGDAEARSVIDEWNNTHEGSDVEYDYERESGKVFNAETMQLEDGKYSDRIEKPRANTDEENEMFRKLADAESVVRYTERDYNKWAEKKKTEHEEMQSFLLQTIEQTDDAKQKAALQEAYNIGQAYVVPTQEEHAKMISDAEATIADVKPLYDARQKEWTDYYDAVRAEEARKFEEAEAIRKKTKPVYAEFTPEEEAANAETIKKAKKEFGTTTDFREAGYILTDGTMLDFSEKKQGGERGRRSLDHRSIERVVDGERWEAVTEFMHEGNIRIMPESGTIDLGRKPTAKQLSKIGAFVRLNDGDVCIEFYDDSKNSEHYVEYEGARYQRVIADINRYFDEGIRPEGNIKWSTRYQDLDAKGKDEYIKDIYGDLSGKEYENVKAFMDGYLENPDALKLEYKVTPVEKHGFDLAMPTSKLKKQVKAWGVANGYPLTITDVESNGKGNIHVSLGSLAKMADESAWKKSSDKDAHFSCLANLKDIICNSHEVESYDNMPYKNSEDQRDPRLGVSGDVRIHRLYGAIEYNGQQYRVKTTLKEDKLNTSMPQKAYSYEVTDIELLSPHHHTLGKETSDTTLDNSSISGAKLLKNVEKTNQKGKYFTESDENEVKNSDRAGVNRKTNTADDEKTLMGVHNLTEDNLRHILKMGGIANPSTAVVDVNKGVLNSFGGISLIMHPESIAKKTGRNAGTWSADAYSPRYPIESVTYSIDSKAEKVLSKELQTDYSLGSVGQTINYIESKGIEGLRTSLPSKVAFAKSIGEDPIVASKSKYTPEITETVKNNAYTPADEYGRRYIERSKWTDEQKEALAKAYKDYFLATHKGLEMLWDAKVQRMLKNYESPADAADWVKESNEEHKKEINQYGATLMQLEEFATDVMRDSRNAGTPDRWETENNTNRIVADNKDAYNKWTQELYDKLGVKEKLFQGYNSSGNRVYKPHTLENVSKMMKKAGRAGGESFFSTSPGALRAKVAPVYTTIEQIRKNKDRIVTPEEFEGIKEQINNEFFELSDLVEGDMSGDEGFYRLEEAMKYGAEWLNRTYDDLDLDSEDIERINAFRELLKTAPTEYFETKFERPVSLYEFAGAVVPKGTSADIVDALKSHGLTVREYDQNTEGDRARVSKELAESKNVMFSTRIEKADPFYSNAAKAVEGIKMDKATPEQWLKMIEKAGGLKKEEDKWMGLSEWLNKQKAMAVVGERGKTLTRQEVEQFIAENSVKVEEVSYSEQADYENNERMKEINAEFEELVYEGDEATGSIYVSDWRDWAFEQMVERYGDDFREAFDYGNDNYTLVPSEDYDGITPQARYFLDINDNPIYGTRLDYTTEGLTNKREIALTVPTVEAYNEGDQIHFGDAGEGRAVAWLRFGDAVDGDGKKVLVVDEIQSKRHQDGREKGYRDKDVRIQYREWKALMQNKYGANWIDKLTVEEFNKGRDLERQSMANAESPVGVPDAPFRSNWHELAMKRALRYAAENGYDRVAWTTGRQQAERYNLGEAIDAITKPKYLEDGSRQYLIKTKTGLEKVAIDPSGMIVDSTIGHTGHQAEEVFGKDLWSRMQNMTDTIKGEDLMIGGEGMKGFYDNMLVKYMSKYGKKWGAKVGEVELDLPNEADRVMHAVDVTPEMKESVMGGQPMFSVRKAKETIDDIVDGPEKIIRNDVGNKHWMDRLTAEGQARMDLYENKTLNEDRVLLKDIANGLGGVPGNAARGAFVGDGEGRYTLDREKALEVAKNTLIGLNRYRNDLDRIKKAHNAMYDSKEYTDVYDAEIKKVNDAIKWYMDFADGGIDDIYAHDDAGIRFSVRGAIGANGMEAMLLDQAKKMLAKYGDNPSDDVRRMVKMVTGWEQGADGKWRLESEDFPMPNRKVHPKTLGEAYPEDHVLFKAYPALKDVELVYNKRTSSAGSYDPEKERITVSKEIWEGKDEMYLKTTMQHEVQHAIQHYEGFATGTNSSDIVSTDAWQKMKQNQPMVFATIELLNGNSWDKLKRIGKERIYDVIKDRYENGYFNSNPRQTEHARFYIEQAADFTDNRFEALMDAAKRTLAQARKEARENYRKSAGEVESRNVEKRMYMDEADRAASLLSDTEDVKRDEQIVKFSTRSDNFKKWFGDWENDPEHASKVVDENGEPMVVYHGSDRDFNEFSTEHGGNMRKEAVGHYFAYYKGTARNYGKNVKAVYLDIKKPYIAETYEEVANLTKQQIANLKEEGYDGVIFDPWKYNKEIKSYYSGDLIEYVAFDPTQIKSATDNNGDYDPNNPDIRYSNRGNNDEARKQMVTEIRHMMDDKRISAMQKSDLNKLLNRVKYVTEDNLLEQIGKARSVMRDIDTKVLGKQLADIMNLKIQDRNGRNMSIAKNVDNTTRLILGQIKKQMYGLTNSEADERMHVLRSQNWHLRDDNRFMQGAMEKGLYGQEGDAEYEEKKAMIEANNARIEANKAEINSLEAERREFIADALEVGSGDVERDLADLTQKMIDACEPDSDIEFTEEDKAMLTSLELLKQRIAIEQLDQELSKWQKQHADAETAQERKALEGVVEQVKQQRYEALKNLVNDIQDVVENGKDALRRRNAEEITHRQELIVNMLGDIRGGKKMPADPEKVKERSKQNWFEGLFASGLKSFEYMAHAIDVNHFSRDGWFYNYFIKGKNGVMAAESTYLRNYEQSMKTLRGKTEEIFGNKADKIAEEGSKTTTEHGITMVVENPDGSTYRIPAHNIYRPDETVPLSKNQATYLYMVWQMGDGRAKMEAQGFDETSIEEIKDFIGEDMIQWADYVQDEYLPSLFPRYNNKYLEIYGTPMSDIEHYVPLKIDQTQTQKESDLQDNKVQKGGMQKKNSFQINRTMNLKPIDLTTDCFKVIQQHVKESEEFNAYATVRKDMDALFSSNAVLNQLNANHRGYAKDLQDAARIAVHSDVPEDVNVIEKGLVKATKGIIGGNIAFRIGTAIKQTLSAPVFYGYTSDPVFMAYLTKSLAKNFTTNVGGVVGGIFAKDTLIKRAEAGKMSGFNEDFRWALENVPSFKNRVSTGDMGMDILNTDMGVMDKYLSKGMAANQLIDAVTCVSGIKAIYEYEMHRMKPMVESGEMTAEEAHNEAVMEADIFYNGTQQSSHRAFMAPIQTSQHAFQKAVTAYQNASMGFARKAAENAVNMMKAVQRQKMIDSYKKTYMLTGIDEAEAEKMAKKQYGKRLRKSLVQLGMFGFMANFLWDLGGRGLFGLFQDDEQKEAAWAWQNIPSYALRGVPGMNIVNGLVQGNLKSPFLLYEELESDRTEIQKLSEKYGGMSPELAGYALVKALRVPGVDLEVMANIYLGMEEAARAAQGDGSWVLAGEFLINLAKTNRKSTMKMIYKDAPIDEQLRNYLRAGKVFDGTDWRKYLPGAKELTEKRYNDVMEELAKVRVKEEGAPMTNKERNEIVKALNSEEALREAYENTTDSVLRTKIMNKAKQMEKDGKKFDFDTATWKQRLDHYEGKEEAKGKKQPKSDAAKAKTYFNSIAGYDVRREEQKMSEYMTKLKEQADEYKANTTQSDEQMKVIDKYEELHGMMTEYNATKTELIQPEAKQTEIMSRLTKMRRQMLDKMK